MKNLVVASTDDMSPDGVKIAVEWDKWELGMSVFIPALYVDKAKSQFLEHAEKRGWTLVTQIVKEDGMLGVRAWRIESPQDEEGEEG